MYIMLLKVYCSSFQLVRLTDQWSTFAAPLQLVRLTDQWSTFYETTMNHLNGQYLLSSAIKKKEREHGKYSVEVHSGKYRTVYEQNMEIMTWVYWCQNKLFYVITVPVVICIFLRI